MPANLSTPELAAVRAAVRKLPGEDVARLHEALAMRRGLLLQRKPGAIVLAVDGAPGLIWTISWPIH